jgi:hypothetical protein
VPALAVAGCLLGDGGVDRWRPTAADQAFLDSLLAAVQPCCARNGFDITGREDEWKQIRLARGFSRDASLRAACLADLQALAGTANCVPLGAAFDDPCVRLFAEPSGPAPPGARCLSPADCAGAPHLITSCGTIVNAPICFAMTAGTLGSRPCTGQSGLDGEIFVSAQVTQPPRQFYCALADGLFCDPVSRSCATLLEAGSPCTDWRACASQTCLGSSGGSLGTCAPVVGLGESCARAVCAEGTRCNTTTATCEARLATGATCQGGGDECVGSCDANHVCSDVTSNEKVAFDGWCI